MLLDVHLIRKNKRKKREKNPSSETEYTRYGGVSLRVRLLRTPVIVQIGISSYDNIIINLLR